MCNFIHQKKINEVMEKIEVKITELETKKAENRIRKSKKNTWSKF